MTQRKLNMKRTSIIICLLVFPTLVISGLQDRDGNPLPETHDRKSSGDFGAWLILTAKEKETIEVWNIPSEWVNIDTEETYKRNEFVTALVVFSGCRENGSGHCNLVVKFKILQPGGKVYADIPAQEAWTGKPSPGKAVQMSVSYVKIRIENHEPLGTYEVLADVIDSNLRETLSLSSKFEVIE